MKFLVLDAGPIISLTMNGLLGVLEELKKNFDGEFIITPQVKREVVDNPIKNRKYSLEAIQVQSLITRGIITLSTEFVPNNKLEVETARVLKITNGYLKSLETGEKITVLHEGEASCLAFANLCKNENLLVVDERTTRIITEAPKNLELLMEKKLHSRLEANLNIISSLGKFRIVRSAELVYVAFKKKLIHLGEDKQVLDALLYALKFKGTTISSQEIEDMKKMM